MEFFFPGGSSRQQIQTSFYNLYPKLPALELARFPRGQNPADETEREFFRVTEKGLKCSRCTREVTYLAVGSWIFLAALSLLALRISLVRGRGCSPLIVC